MRARQQGLPNAAIADDGGVFTDETTEANSATTNDMTIFPATVAVNDAYYFGHSEQFTRLKVDVSTAITGILVVVWEYWDGGAWVVLTELVDGTSMWTNVGENTVSYTLPGDWATTTVNSQGPYYFVRTRLSSVASGTGPLGRKCKLDVTRYLPFVQNNTITSSGLSTVASWAVDSIAIF